MIFQIKSFLDGSRTGKNLESPAHLKMSVSDSSIVQNERLAEGLRYELVFKQEKKIKIVTKSGKSSE